MRKVSTTVVLAAVTTGQHSDDTRRSTPEREKVPTPPAMTKTTSTLDMPVKALNVESNKQFSLRETTPKIAKMAFPRRLKATAQIWATLHAIYVVHNQCQPLDIGPFPVKNPSETN